MHFYMKNGKRVDFLLLFVALHYITYYTCRIVKGIMERISGGVRKRINVQKNPFLQDKSFLDDCICMHAFQTEDKEGK